MRASTFRGGFLGLLLVGLAMPAVAGTVKWTGGDGVWTNVNQWSGGSVPVVDDTVYITNSGPDDMTITYENPANPQLGNLYLNRTGGGTLIITQAQDSITVSNKIQMGTVAGSNVRYIQNGGFNVLGTAWPGVWSIGYAVGATATYHLVSGTLAAAGNYGGAVVNVQIGCVGTGYFIQDGGVFDGSKDPAALAHALMELVVGGAIPSYNFSRTSGGTGFYTMNDGILLFRNLYIGSVDGASGTFVQNSGTNYCSTHNIGFNSAKGSYTFNDGRLWSTTFNLGERGGTGTWTQTAGMIDTPRSGTNVAVHFYAGGSGTNAYGAPGMGTCNMNGGTNAPYYSQFQIGVGGRGILNQTDGLINWTVNHGGQESYNIKIAMTNGAYGTVNLSGGELRAKTVAVGNGGTCTGEVNQTGGILAIGGGTFGGLIIGRGAGPNPGAYGFYNLGDASTSGMITNATGFATYNDLTIRQTTNAIGILRGWGSVYLDDFFVNNGQVKADGYGTSRTLYLDKFAQVSNLIENARNEVNGWYAQDHGKLVLPNVTVSAVAAGYNWGESTNDAAIDLVNSVRLSFSGQTAGALTGALLATNHADVAAREPLYCKFLSIHDFTHSAAVGSCVLTFRYDPAGLVAPGYPNPLAENTIKVWHYTGGAWQDVTASVDPGTKTVTSAAVTSLSQFAVTARLPQPAGSLIYVR